MYTHSLVPADFSGAVFTCAFFQKMSFLLYKLRNAFLVTNDLSGADLVRKHMKVETTYKTFAVYILPFLQLGSN